MVNTLNNDSSDTIVITTAGDLHSQVTLEYTRALRLMRLISNPESRESYRRELELALNPLSNDEKLRRIANIRIRMAAEIAADEVAQS